MRSCTSALLFPEQALTLPIMKKPLKNIEELLEIAWDNPKNDLFFCEVMRVPEKQAVFILQTFGISVGGFFHILDNYVLRHVQAKHGNPQIEISRGQIPVQREDFLLIPTLILEPDVLKYEFARNKHTLIYQKAIDNQIYAYAAEIRSSKRRLICGQSLRIKAIKKAG